MERLSHINQGFNLPRESLQPPQLLLRQNSPRIKLAHRKHHTLLQIVNRSQKQLIATLKTTLAILNHNKPSPTYRNPKNKRQPATDKAERNSPINSPIHKFTATNNTRPRPNFTLDNMKLHAKQHRTTRQTEPSPPYRNKNSAPNTNKKASPKHQKIFRHSY